MEIPAKKLLPRTPHFGVVLDVHDVNGHLYDVRHGASRSLHEAADLTEDHLRLFVFIAALDGPAVAGAGTMPEMKSMSPTRKALDHRPGGLQRHEGSLLFRSSCSYPPLTHLRARNRKARSRVAYCAEETRQDPERVNRAATR